METLLLTYTCHHDSDDNVYGDDDGDDEDDNTMTKTAVKQESCAWPDGKDFIESCNLLSSTCICICICICISYNHVIFSLQPASNQFQLIEGNAQS